MSLAGRAAPRRGWVIAMSMALAAVPFGARAGTTIPSFESVARTFVSSDGVLLDRHGAPLSDVRIDARVRRLEWVALDEVSPAMSAALVAGEDRRFEEHHGVDWTGLAGAAWDSLWRTLDGRAPRGGSTITMQLASFLDPALAPRRTTRDLRQKWDQVQAALALEQRWSKAQILEAYLNLATYRGELAGLAAASRGLFGKAPQGIDEREGAVLVALLRSPGARAAAIARRACVVARLAGSAHSCESIRATALAALGTRYRIAARRDDAPHLAGKLLKTPGERLVTTLDGDLQRFAAGALQEHLADLAERSVGDGALVVLDNATGDVLAYVGSAGARSAAGQVDGVTALRQPGSTLKPFLYALAIDARVLTAASLVDDSAVAIATERGMYVPQNYDRDFKGQVSVRTALAGSLNVPAVRTVELLGVDRFYDVLKRLGFATLAEDDRFYGAGLALGDAEVTLLSLTNAYRALANGGVVGPIQVVAGTPIGAPAQRVLGAAAAYVVADILSDRGARSVSFGLDNPMATRVWSAVKTGTSKDMRDNWCVGFTDRFTVGVWVGNFSGAPMHDVSGVTGAAPIWRDLVHRLHASIPSGPPRPPPGLVRRPVAFEPEVESQRVEWFVRGTEAAVMRDAGTAARAEGPGAAMSATPRIRYPSAGAVIALDPDIPASAQRLALRAAPVRPGLQWRLDGEVLASRPLRGELYWSPTPGRHVLALEDADGRNLSQVAFEVRGNDAQSRPAD